MEPLPRYRFEQLVADALDELPDELQPVLDNVVVQVADRDPDEPDLLGLYHGVPHTERTGHEGPDVVTIYRLALCEACDDLDELVDEVYVTVIHEIAHTAGIDDARLRELDGREAPPDAGAPRCGPAVGGVRRQQRRAERVRSITRHRDPRRLGRCGPSTGGCSAPTCRPGSDPDKLADPAFQAAATTLGTTLLRFPGGSWSNGYDWLACERDVEPDCFATWPAQPSDFVGFMQATGLPGVWTTSFSGTAEEAAAAVAFFNGDVDDDRPTRRRPRRARLEDRRRVGASYASLEDIHEPAGIEPVGDRQRGVRRPAGGGLATVRSSGGRTCGRATAPTYVDGDDEHDGYLEFHEQMRIVDPEIEVGAVGLFDGESWGSWGSEVIAGTGERLDFYVIHHYGFAGEPDEGAALALPQSSWPELMQVATETLAVGNPVANRSGGDHRIQPGRVPGCRRRPADGARDQPALHR